MTELQLTRSSEDRRRYELDGVGWLRLKGWSSRAATAQAGARRWEIVRKGLWKRGIEVTDAAGAGAGEFARHALHRGGTLRWGDRELELRPDSSWRHRYVLADGDRRLATIEGKSWGKRPVRIAVEDAAPIDPGLLLFATFVVRALAAEAASASSAAATTAAVTAG